MTRTAQPALVLCWFQPGSGAYEAARRLRYDVLRRPLGLPPGSEAFPWEDECLHLVAAIPGPDEGAPVGTVMFHPERATGGRLLQMAVAAPWRGQGVGTALLSTMEARLLQDGLVDVHLHAREAAVPFYAGRGYRVVGVPFVDLGIVHAMMRKRLRPGVSPFCRSEDAHGARRCKEAG